MSHYTATHRGTPLPTRLNRAFIGIETTDWQKVRPLLPQPSILNSFDDAATVQAVWVLDVPLSSPKQWRWCADIKLTLRDRLEGVAFRFIDECYTDNYTETTGCVYSLDQLSKLLGVTLRRYPMILFAADPKDLYRQLCRWARWAVRKGVYTHEAVVATALTINAKFDPVQRLQYKDALKKAAAVDKWVRDNYEGLRALKGEQLKQAHRAGALKKNAKQGNATRQRIEALLATGDYTKPNGRIDAVRLAKVLKMSARTVRRHLKAML